MEKLYVTCPVCGATQGKSGEGTNTEADCKKCKAKLSYEVKNDTVLVHVVSPSPKTKINPA
jgi:hypothetical protein